ncbi:MAG: hypothetical protein ACK40Y_10465 [Cloacibacterium caeni]
MKNGGGHFAPKLGGHFELESGGHFKLELGGQYHWNLHKLADSMIFFKNSDQPDYGHVVKYMKDKRTTAVWLDFKDLNQMGA